MASRPARAASTPPGRSGAEALSYADLLLALGSRLAERAPTPIIRYEGQSGSGHSYALEHHQDDPVSQRVFLNCKAHTHRSLLLTSLLPCGATPPQGAPIAELAEAAALESGPTLLLLDNCEHASAKLILSLHNLYPAAFPAYSR